MDSVNNLVLPDLDALSSFSETRRKEMPDIDESEFFVDDNDSFKTEQNEIKTPQAEDSIPSIEEPEPVADSIQLSEEERKLVEEFDLDMDVEDEEDDLLADQDSNDDDEDDEAEGYSLAKEVGIDFDQILNDAVDAGTSDVYMVPNELVAFKILGDIKRQPQYGLINGRMMLRLQQNIISHVLESDFVENLELDTSYTIDTGKHRGRRWRLNIGKTFADPFMVLRLVNASVPKPSELKIPKAMQDWFFLPKGLILVTGPTGSGKSTSIASLIRSIQLNLPKTIITIEKPIEFMFGYDGKALVVQREIGKDARTFTAALTSAMREAPDVIFVGEVRNQDEVSALLTASETGHLAVSTMHTNNAAETLNRISSLFEGEDKIRVLVSLADSVQGIASQTLVKTIDGKSRFAVYEVLEITPDVRSFIREGRVKDLADYVWENETSMEHNLIRATVEGRCSFEEALAHSSRPQLMKELAKKERLI